MAAYLMGTIEVSDAEAYAAYATKTPELAKKFGGKFLVKGGAFERLEGEGYSRHVVIEFPDVATAKAFYDDAEYQAVLPIALANSVRNLVIVEGA